MGLTFARPESKCKEADGIWSSLVDRNLTDLYSFKMCRDGSPFNKAVDDALTSYFKSGEGKKSYENWFESPIPPKDSNIKSEESDWLKDLIG